MPYLDPVVQEFVAEAARFITPMQAMIKEVEDATKAVLELKAAIASLDGKTVEISARVSGIAGPVKGAIAQITALKTAMAGLDDKTVKVGADVRRFTGGAWGLVGALGGWRNVIHWIIMGTLEIAATAIPALVAFGAAVAGMTPTFIHISDQMHNLLIASGGLKNAFLNSVGPLHQLGVNMGNLTRQMAPNAYIIFGAAINSLSGHFGTFATMAQKAGNVLSAFATKLSAELTGPLGSKITGFFANAVKYMIQWGQVIGNLAHTFFNAMNAMWGVGQLLLDVLNLISRALLIISSTKVGAVFIGLAAAMSAAYRYAKLLAGMWVWMGGPVLKTLIVETASYISMLIALGRELGVVAAIAQLTGDAMDLAMGPIGWAILAITAIAAIWVVAAHQAADATTNLINHFNKLPPTVTNLTNGIQALTSHYGQLAAKSAQVTAAQEKTAQSSIHSKMGFETAGIGAMAFQGDLNATAQAVLKFSRELWNLATGLVQAGMRGGQVGAAMNALAIQTALADSKIQQYNQAIDQYIGLLTGGTSATAQFTQSLANMTSVQATTGLNNLSRSTSTATLTVNQFSRALGSLSGKGAGAWNNFNQVLGGTMPQLLDWFRQAAVLGAATGKDVTRAALDMAKAMVPFARHSQAAKNELLGFLRAQGLNIKSFHQLEHMVKQNGVGMHDLQKRVFAATGAMSHLSQMAQNVATALSQQVTAQLAQAALGSTSFHTDLQGLQKAMADNAPPSVIHQWMVKIANDTQTAGNRSTTMGNQYQKAMALVGQSSNSAMTTSQSSIDHTLIHAKQLQNFIDTMHGKTLYFQMVTLGSVPGQTSTPGPPGPPHHRPANLPGQVFVPAMTGGGGGGTNITIVHQHIAGSMLTEQQAAAYVQQGTLRKTFRNGSTQTYLPGRLH